MIIHHHLGLGDHFICNGLVNFIAKQNTGSIDLICKKHNFETVQCLYSENKNINVIPIECYNEINEVDNYVKQTDQELLRIGFNKLVSVEKFDRQFYNQINLDFHNRYSLSYIPNSTRDSEQLYQTLAAQYKEYILIHNTCSYGKIDIKTNTNLPIIYISEITNNILDWIKIIEKAKEIHIIPSSVFCLIDSLNVSRTSNHLFYHNNRKNTIIDINHKENNNKWSIINYEQQL